MLGTPEKLLFNVDGLVFAVGGVDRLDVARSLAVEPDAPLLAPVRRFVRDAGLVLVESMEMDTTTMEFGRAEFTSYISPAARRDGREPERLTVEDFDLDEVMILRVWAREVIASE